MESRKWAPIIADARPAIMFLFAFLNTPPDPPGWWDIYHNGDRINIATKAQ